MASLGTLPRVSSPQILDRVSTDFDFSFSNTAWAEAPAFKAYRAYMVEFSIVPMQSVQCRVMRRGSRRVGTSRGVTLQRLGPLFGMG